jgi:hypothetical protein
MRGGGVLVATRNFDNNFVFICRMPGIEAVQVTLSRRGISFHLCIMYRHPESIHERFRNSMAQLVGHMRPHIPSVVVGDVNEQHTDAASSNVPWITKIMNEFGFMSENIPSPTTDFGSTIDRVFTRYIGNIQVHVNDCYYSDHDMILICLQL